MKYQGIQAYFLELYIALGLCAVYEKLDDSNLFVDLMKRSGILTVLTNCHE